MQRDEIAPPKALIMAGVLPRPLGYEKLRLLELQRNMKQNKVISEKTRIKNRIKKWRLDRRPRGVWKDK